MNDFSEKIVQELERRGVVPKPRWQFLVSRWVFWLLAGLSALVGGMAFAVAEYVFYDNDGISRASLEQANMLYIAKSIPYLWLAILGLFIACAYYGFRKTRQGYRYATILVVCAALVASVSFGLILSEFDFGKTVHIYLLKHTSFYDPLIFSRDNLGE